MGCGDESGSSYDIGWLIGASSTFEATTEGVLDGSLAGTAEFRTDAGGNLVGIELIHTDDSSRGISIELEPHPLEQRTYAAIVPQLMGVERPDTQAGFAAFFESSTHSFQAARGTLRVEQVGDAYVRGTFDMEMRGTAEGGSFQEDDVMVRGTFYATRPE